jgi:ligand-binding sensor domain-containing protein
MEPDSQLMGLPDSLRRRRSTATARSLALALLLVFGTPIAAATEVDDVCECYGLTAWTSESGLPTGTVFAMAQDPTGYLWLGTSEGLISFAGRMTPRAAPPRCTV